MNAWEIVITMLAGALCITLGMVAAAAISRRRR